jgi:hypothetical protein
VFIITSIYNPEEVFKGAALALGYLLHIVAELAQNEFIMIPGVIILAIMGVSKFLIDAGED